MKFFIQLLSVWFLIGPTLVAADTTLLASIRPLALLAHDLLLEDDKLEQLLPSSASPHHYQLTLSDREKLQSADIVLWVGPPLESFLAKVIRQRSDVITAMELAPISWPEQDVAGHSHHHHNHGHQQLKDPHLWLNPDNLKTIARAITEALVTQKPAQAEAYHHKLKRVLKQLDISDEKLQQQLKGLSRKAFLVLHPAYDHFIQRYGLKQLAALVTMPEATMSVKHRYRLQGLDEVSCVFGEEGEDNKRAQQIAQQLTAQTALLDPLGITLPNTAGSVAILEKMGEQMSQCLAHSTGND